MKMDENKIDRVRLVAHGCGEAKFAHLTKAEVDVMQSLSTGSSWVRVKDGRLETRPCFEEPPLPEQDPLIPPKWIHKETENWEKLAPFLRNPTPLEPALGEPRRVYESPSFIIQSLCGYNDTPYETEARKLQDFGFECLRSRRGADGHFWEIWYLPGLWYAKGPLKELYLPEGTVKSINKAIDFLCRYVSFGTLHVCYQRAAMIID